MKDNWNNPHNYEANKRQVAFAAGPLVLDTTACYFGTGLGGRLAAPINNLMDIPLTRSIGSRLSKIQATHNVPPPRW